MSERSDALERMLLSRPADHRLRFGLAIEYLRDGRTEEGIEHLRAYLSTADDEGNAWARLAEALLQLGRVDEARDAFRLGVAAATQHGHPTLAGELEAALSALEP